MLRAVLFAVALGSGAVSAWLVAAMPVSTSGAERPEQKPVLLEQVLVTAETLAQGEPIKQEQMRWQPWPKEALTPAFITQASQPDAPKELAGLIVLAPMSKGEPLFKDKVAPMTASYLSAALSPGMRAVAIPISAAKTAGGFILPNDRVDVMLAVPCRPEDGCHGGTIVHNILQNVRVLAIDQGKDSLTESVIVGKTATLELEPQQAARLIGADATGTLSLVLRSASDNDELSVSAPPEQSETVRIWRKGVSEFVTIR